MNLEKNNTSAKIKAFIIKYGTVLGLIVLCALFTILSDRFFTVNNIINVLRQVSINAFIAFGMTFVIITGGIDLSVGSIVAVSGVFSCGLVENGYPIIVGVLVGLALSLVFGVINGFFISKVHMPAFIVTLSTMTIARGFAYIYTGGEPIRSNNSTYNSIGNGYLGPIPVPVLIMLFVFIISCILLHKTKYGRYVYAIGGNRDSAKYSGINIFKVELITYMISSLFAAICGVVLAARMYSGQPTVGDGFELDAIASIVLGGASFSGGVGVMPGTLVGALIIGVLNNGLNILNVPHYYQLIIKGIVILLAILIDTIKKEKS